MAQRTLRTIGSCPLFFAALIFRSMTPPRYACQQPKKLSFLTASPENTAGWLTEKGNLQKQVALNFDLRFTLKAPQTPNCHSLFGASSVFGSSVFGASSAGASVFGASPSWACASSPSCECGTTAPPATPEPPPPPPGPDGFSSAVHPSIQDTLPNNTNVPSDRINFISQPFKKPVKTQCRDPKTACPNG